MKEKTHIKLITTHGKTVYFGIELLKRCVIFQNVDEGYWEIFNPFDEGAINWKVKESPLDLLKKE